MVVEPTVLRIEVAAVGNGVLVCLDGDLEAESAASLVAEGERLSAAGHRRLTLDCAALTFCDSYGLHAMDQLRHQVQPDGSVTIVNPSDLLTRILQITDLADKFGIAPTSG